MSIFKRQNSGYGYYANTSGLSNACKTILANIRFMDVDKPVCSIVITSAIPNEGKSFVAENLCRAIASSGKTVLLVEADMRRSTLAGRLKAHAKHGIYSVLSGAVSVDQAVTATDTPNMFFLDAEPGIPNPSDLLNSRQFERFVPIVCSAYDYVVFDTPPVGAFVDAAVLSRLVDATFIVVREDFVRREQVAAAYDQLVKAGGNVAGVIMNYCERSGSDYYYYSRYYHDYEDDGSGKRRKRHHHHEGLFGGRRKPSASDSATSISGGKSVSSARRMPSAKEVMEGERVRSAAGRTVQASSAPARGGVTPAPREEAPSPTTSRRPSALHMQNEDE
jgi:capsular exopolysaccharide synthesis family protein